MTTDYTAKQGDTAIVCAGTLTYSDGSSPALAGASVQFVMRQLAQTVPTTNAAATITNATSPATVSYTLTAADTKLPGLYVQTWVVTFQNGTVETFPTEGYNSVEIQENLLTPNQTIVELTDVKDYLNIPATSHAHDTKLLRLMTGLTDVVEGLAGDVLPHERNEWYDGGQYWIHFRHRPVLQLIAVSEWRGPIEYPLAIIQDPAHGSIYSCMADRPPGSEGPSRVVRRSAGGGVIAFPNMPQAVHVVYVSGRQTVSDHLRYGTLELIRVNYQQTQQGGGPFGAAANEDGMPTGPTMGFLVPNRVREILARGRRHPRVA